MNEKLGKIAKEILQINTLYARDSDSLDFHELAVWDIKDALEAAYNEGHAQGYNEGRSQGRSQGYNEASPNFSKLCVCGIYPCDRHHPDEFALQEKLK